MDHRIKTLFDFGDMVFLRGQEIAEPGIVIGYALEPGFRVKAIVRWDGLMENSHWEFELTARDPEEITIDKDEEYQ